MPKILFTLVAFSGLLLAQLPGGTWKTDLSRKSIDLRELRSGGPPKDGIRAIDHPKFVGVQAAARWLDAKEPVMVFEHAGEVRAYPVQILMFHELVNDQIGGLPFLVSYCPLCNSAIVFDRRLDGKTYVFGVSGMLRNSDMVMFDRQTESLWQQITGEGIVGQLTGKRLKVLASPMVSFESFAKTYPDGVVLSRETGFSLPYGQNPYADYEFRGGRLPATDGQSLNPMERLVVFTAGKETRAYPFAFLRRFGVMSGRVKDTRYVVFFQEGAKSPLDAGRISEGREVGSAGVFLAEVDGEHLKFKQKDGRFVDEKTGSTWNILGIATGGPLAGKRLKPLPYHEAFAFAWLAFRPDTKVLGGPDAP